MDMIEIGVSDELSPTVQHALERNKKFVSSVSKSIGFHVQKYIKQAVRSGELASESAGWQRKWFTEGARPPRRELQGGNASTFLYGQMARAIGYAYNQDASAVDIGWTSRTSAMYGRYNEEGGAQPVTKSIRDRWFAVYKAEIAKYGKEALASHDFSKFLYPLSAKKTELETPSRPIFLPTMQKVEPKLPAFIDKKVEDYMNGNVEFGKKNRRKYRIYRA